MASSSMPEDAHDTPAALINTPPGICTQLAFENLKLNHEWEIGEKILKENERHAAVYSVLISETGQSAESLEAHVFALDGIDPKLRKHRQRCIKRMKGRTELKVQVDGITIVVITTSQTGNADASEHGVEPCSMSKQGQQETDGDTSSIRKMKQKSPYQLESQRIRQKERRQARRATRTRQRNERTTDREHNATESTTDSVISLDGQNELSMFVFLLLELVHAWSPSTATPSKYIELAEDTGSGCVYDMNMLKEAVSLQTIEEMESYLKTRRSEIISLRRHRAKISSAEEYHWCNLMIIQQALDQDSEPKAKAQLNLLRLANEIIDNLLLSRKFIVRLVERTIFLTHMGTAAGELRVSQYKGWIGTMVPYPVAQADVLRLMESSNNRMATWEKLLEGNF